MLRANVGISRKVSRNSNSDGYSVNLDAEVNATIEDSEAVLDRVQELFHLAEEALAQEIDRDQGEAAIGRHDEDRQGPNPRNNQGPVRSGNGSANQLSPSSVNGPRQELDVLATNKQVQFLLTMGKRLKLSIPQLEGKVAEVIGRRCGVYDLTKNEARLVLDQFTKTSAATGGR